MELITNKDALIKAIDSIHTRGKKLDQDIHVAACSSLQHLEEHGDIGMVNRLYNALPKGARKAAMTEWLLKFARVIANDDGKTKATKPFSYSKDKTSDLQGGIKTPWYDLKKDQAPDEVFDIRAAVEAVIKKAQGKDLAHAELLTALQALVTDPVEAEVLTDGDTA